MIFQGLIIFFGLGNFSDFAGNPRVFFFGGGGLDFSPHSIMSVS